MTKRRNPMRLDFIATLTIVTSIAAAGCSEDAVVGEEPIACESAAVAEVYGSINDRSMSPIDRLEYFDSDGPGIVNLGHVAGVDFIDTLRLTFACGTAEVGTYSILAGGNNSLGERCEGGELIALGVFFASDQSSSASAEEGTVIVDQADDCVAGRFALDFDSGDSVSGWFSVPRQ